MNQEVDNQLGGFIAEANQEAIVSPQERKVLMDRRFAFSADLERIVWTEADRIARLQMVENSK